MASANRPVAPPRWEEWRLAGGGGRLKMATNVGASLPSTYIKPGGHLHAAGTNISSRKGGAMGLTRGATLTNFPHTTPAEGGRAYGWRHMFAPSGHSWLFYLPCATPLKHLCVARVLYGTRQTCGVGLSLSAAPPLCDRAYKRCWA